MRASCGAVVYLKQVRSLSRKQFYHRKLSMKIAEAQKEREAQKPRSRAASSNLTGEGDWDILQDFALDLSSKK